MSGDATIPAISVEGLDYTHPGESEPLLRGVALSVAAGETLAITGPSGSGKTTLLNLIAGLLSPTGGAITVQGRPISALPPSARARWRGEAIGYAYQDARLLPQLDVVTNVAWPLLFGDLTRRQALERAENLLARLGLAPLARHRPTTLSGGEQRRMTLARALVARPPLLLVDEPTANLDDEAAAEVMALLRQVQREFQTTLLLISHRPALIHPGDRRLALRDGALHAVGETD